MKPSSMKFLLAGLFFLTLNLACAQNCFLMVSSGGGITGAATVYKISMDGTVLKGKGLGQVHYDQHSKLSKSKARKYYKKVKQLTDSSTYNHPGNLYYSIAALENDKERRITWGDAEHPVPEEAKTLYQELTTILSGLPFTATATK
jgi:hypothetical protein